MLLQHLRDEPFELVAIAFGEGEEDLFLPAKVGFEELGVTFKGISPLLVGRSGHIFLGRHIVFKHLGEYQELMMFAGKRSKGGMSFHK